MSESGTRLRNNNERIVKLMALLKKERDEMNFLIEKQQDEKVKIQNEIEKLTFKLALLTKSLNQRVQARSNYDKTIKEIEGNYSVLVDDSAKLLDCLTKEVQVLEELMDKKTSTDPSKPKSAENAVKEPEIIQTEPAVDDEPQLEKEPSEVKQPEIREPEVIQDIKEANEVSPKSSPILETTPDYFDNDQLDLDDDEVEVKWAHKKLRSNEHMVPKVGPSYLEKIPTVKEAKKRSSSMLQERRRSGRSSSSSSKNGVPSFKNANDNASIDVEVQSFREAYGRQHMPASPPGESSRRSSHGSRNKN